MAEKDKDQENGSMLIDVQKMYAYQPEDLTPDISYSTYSNLAYIQVTQRDVYIDFLEMPGIRREDGKMHINGTRVYMSHAAAQKLSEALNGILKKVYTEGGMESYSLSRRDQNRLSSKIEHKSKDQLL